LKVAAVEGSAVEEHWWCWSGGHGGSFGLTEAVR